MDEAARRAREIFLDALELDPIERLAHIDSAAAGDAAIGARAKQLLAAHESSASIFDERG